MRLLDKSHVIVSPNAEHLSKSMLLAFWGGAIALGIHWPPIHVPLQLLQEEAATDCCAVVSDINVRGDTKEIRTTEMV